MPVETPTPPPVSRSPRHRHRQRLERNPQTRAAIGARDLELLKLFATLRVASADTLMPLLAAHFPTSFVLWRRLRRLYDAGHLMRPPAQEALRRLKAGRAPDLYCLGNRGAKALRAAGLELPATDFDQKAKELSAFGLAHMLATSEAVAHFLAAIRTRPELELVRVLRDGELRVRVRYLDGDRERDAILKPDATLIVSEGGAAPTALFLEIDRNTMPARRTDASQSYFLKKCRLYLAWWQRAEQIRATLNADDFLVMTIAPTSERAAALRDVARTADAEQRGTDLFWFTTRDALTPQAALSSPIWTTAAGTTGSLYDEPDF